MGYYFQFCALPQTGYTHNTGNVNKTNMNATKYHVLGDEDEKEDSPKRASPTILMSHPRTFVVLNLILLAVSCSLLLARALLLGATPERLPCKQDPFSGCK